MKAIIIAAGKATRLLPLTKEIPQCLLNIGKKTILELQIEGLKKAGIKDIMVITGHLSEKVESFCKKIGIKILFNPFYEVSGMSLTLWIAREELRDGFIFLYSDTLFDSSIIKGLMANKGDICLAIKKDGIREEAEKVIEERGVIKKLSKYVNNNGYSESIGEFIGIAKFSSMGARKIIEGLDKVAKKNINSSFINLISNLVDSGEPVLAYNIKDAQFYDIDFPGDLEKAKKLFKI